MSVKRTYSRAGSPGRKFRRRLSAEGSGSESSQAFGGGSPFGSGESNDGSGFSESEASSLEFDEAPAAAASKPRCARGGAAHPHVKIPSSSDMIRRCRPQAERVGLPQNVHGHPSAKIFSAGARRPAGPSRAIGSDHVDH